MPDADDNDGLAAKLTWRCRRGTRELDFLLSGFMARRFRGLGPELRGAFEVLLDQEDPVIIDWLWGRARPADVGVREVVALIRKDAGME